LLKVVLHVTRTGARGSGRILTPARPTYGSHSVGTLKFCA
jgi:hypothetical protein